MGIQQCLPCLRSPPPPPPPPSTPPKLEPWRSIGKKGQEATWDEEMEKALRDECLRADLELLGQRHVRILVLGATGSGKSSFINSLYSALSDHVGQYTHTESSTASVTQLLYNPPLRIEGREPYFRIQDAPGITERDENFITFALQGHLKEDVELPSGTTPQDEDHYVETPEVMDRPCLVVFVLGPSSQPSDSVLKGKWDVVKKQARQNNIKLAIVLTKADLLSADEEHPLKNADAKYTFQSKAALTAVYQASEVTGLPPNRIFPATNYVEQTETCTEMNIVLLYTLSKLLADAKLEAERRLEPERLEAERRLVVERAAGPENPD